MCVCPDGRTHEVVIHTKIHTKCEARYNERYTNSRVVLSSFLLGNTLIMQSTKRGFTLIELLVVIAIIGLLASIVLASLNSARKKSRDARRLADLKQLQNALELYANDNGGNYPNSASTAPVSTALSAALVSGGTTYIAALPGDPLGGSYVYNYKSNAASNSTAYCLGGVLEGNAPTPSSTCNAATSIINTADYGGGAVMTYTVGNS
jgi:type II secretion system protein G